jgi:hypothetical protein
VHAVVSPRLSQDGHDGIDMPVALCLRLLRRAAEIHRAGLKSYGLLIAAAGTRRYLFTATGVVVPHEAFLSAQHAQRQPVVQHVSSVDAFLVPQRHQTRVAARRLNRASTPVIVNGLPADADRLCGRLARGDRYRDELQQPRLPWVEQRSESAGRPATNVYRLRSLVAMDAKSACSRICAAHSAAAGTSIITPAIGTKAQLKATKQPSPLGRRANAESRRLRCRPTDTNPVSLVTDSRLPGQDADRIGHTEHSEP